MTNYVTVPGPAILPPFPGPVRGISGLVDLKGSSSSFLMMSLVISLT